MEDILAILECLRGFVIDRASQESFEMTTALLLELMKVYGVHSEAMRHMFPLLEVLKDDVQSSRFEAALPKVLALLETFRGADQAEKDTSMSTEPTEEEAGGYEIVRLLAELMPRDARMPYTELEAKQERLRQKLTGLTLKPPHKTKQ